MEKQDKVKVKPEEEGSLILSYLLFFAFIPSIINRKNAFILWHSKQGMILFFMEVLCLVLGALLSIFSLWFNYVFYFLAGLVFILGLKALKRSLNGEKWAVPGLSLFINKLP